MVQKVKKNKVKSLVSGYLLKHNLEANHRNTWDSLVKTNIDFILQKNYKEKN